jgi:hypothetical protein
MLRHVKCVREVVVAMEVERRAWIVVVVAA